MTSSSREPAKRPSPIRISTFLFLRRVPIPVVSRSTIPSFHSTIFSRSTESLPTFTPIAPAPWIELTSFEAWIRAFDGMHPTLRQTPPRYALSTIAVSTPSWASRIAAT